MKTTIMLLLGCMLFTSMATSLMAQGSPVASGGDATGPGGTASFSVGEIAYSSISADSGIIIEGVQQAYTPTTLPVTLIQFKATVTGKKEVALNWVTIAEYNNAFFTVEHSADGIVFKQLSIVNSNGNSSATQSYATIDYAPYSGTSYYRLKQTDKGGKSTYSTSVAVTIAGDANGTLSVYPNPTTAILTLQIQDASTRSLSYSIFNLQGKLIAQQKINNNTTVITTSGLANGIYLLEVMDKNNLIKSFKVIKN
ncbi:T9SS type A sorting domain-containing protein [Parasediminibacterium sp. JCM 36343]|uniref:T9SS type A sorting domain-containing protein n=1 Tax=Parasediminibacterium sp. JCM 36343 TaxID=3374279 RepID=UPI00397C499D